MLRNVEVKHVGHCTDQEIHVVTVVGKAEEVRDRDLSNTEPLIQAVNLNGRSIFALKKADTITKTLRCVPYKFVSRDMTVKDE